MKKYRTALTIAGSDPSGGAGLQADLKTFSALGVYGSSAVVAVVDENTLGVYDVHPIPVKIVTGQIRSVLDDIGADAVKIGMLATSELICAVRSTLDLYPHLRNVVLDPVMVATSGDRLIEPDAEETLRTVLIPRARVITPNLPEAEVLLGHHVDRSNLKASAQELSRLAPQGVSVMLKGGHMDDLTIVDGFYNAEDGTYIEIPLRKISTPNTHGTGCTLSSAIAAYLARGEGLTDAVVKAREYIARAIAAGADYSIGKGHGPVCHFHNLWN